MNLLPKKGPEFNYTKIGSKIGLCRRDLLYVHWQPLQLKEGSLQACHAGLANRGPFSSDSASGLLNTLSRTVPSMLNRWFKFHQTQQIQINHQYFLIRQCLQLALRRQRVSIFLSYLQSPMQQNEQDAESLGPHLPSWGAQSNACSPRRPVDRRSTPAGPPRKPPMRAEAPRYQELGGRSWTTRRPPRRRLSSSSATCTSGRPRLPLRRPRRRRGKAPEPPHRAPNGTRSSMGRRSWRGSEDWRVG